MYKTLSQNERERLLSQVTEAQRDFLLNKVKRGKRTIFGNIMVNEKISVIKTVDVTLQEDEKEVLDWTITDFVDFGKGNRFGKCACGLTLRFMFTVKHLKTGKTIKYGKDHLSEFLNIGVKEIKGIISDLSAIDYELDQLLLKIESNDYGYEIFYKVSDKMEVPKDIKEHIEAKVPFLDSQINRLYRNFEKLRDAEWIEERRAIFDSEQQRLHLEKERKEAMLQERKEKDREILEITKRQLHTSATFDEIAYSLVQNGVNSALEISHIMINHFGADNRLSINSMKRPYIYYDVLIALNKEVEKGNLHLDESSDMGDCIFVKNSNREKVSEGKKEEQQTFAL